MKYLQEVVEKWICSTMDEQTFLSTRERARRLLEEALELVQATDVVSEEDCHALVSSVYSRPVGVVGQEVGGVAVCAFALCENLNLDFYEELNREITRIHRPEIVEKVRRRWREKAENGTGIQTTGNTAQRG